MDSDEPEAEQIYIVLTNSEEQYSIWPKHLEIPPGWLSVGKEGTLAQCSAQVDQLWVDMRPLSLRKLMSH